MGNALNFNNKKLSASFLLCTICMNHNTVHLQLGYKSQQVEHKN